MDQVRTTALFSSDAFNPRARRQLFLTSRPQDDDLLGRIAAGLRVRGAEVAEEPTPERSGWSLAFSVGGKACSLVVGYRPGEAAAAGTWVVTVERSRGLVGSLLRLRGANVGMAALSVVHQVLVGMPGVSSVRWLHASDLQAGREHAGAATPDAP